MTDESGVTAQNDYPCVEFHVPMFSESAVQSLRAFLEPNGELLPVRSTVGNFFAYQARTIVDNLLDSKKTVGDHMAPDSPIFYDIKKYAFKRYAKPLPQIFRIRENPSPVLVTSEFKKTVLAKKLKGFSFLTLPRA
jgi:hypothetical protein